MDFVIEKLLLRKSWLSKILFYFIILIWRLVSKIVDKPLKRINLYKG